MTDSVDDLASVLDEIAAWTRLDQGSDGFRVRAWREAARAVRQLGGRVRDLPETELRDVKGLGRSSVEVIEQWRAGRPITRLEALRAAHPPGMLELLRVPGLGPKLVGLLHEVLGVSSVADLRRAVDEGTLASLPGMGPATIEALRDALALGTSSRLPLAEVLEALPGRAIAASDPDLEADRLPPQGALAGAARRGEDHLDEVVVVTSPDHQVMEADVAAATSLPARVVAAEHERAGWDLVRATGPEAHVDSLRARAQEQGLRLTEEGLLDGDGARVVVPTEHAFYDALGLPWVPPERRHRDDALASSAGPALVTADDVRGDFHVHTTWSGDGRSSLPAMVAALATRGFTYSAITDHAEDLRINGLDRDQMLQQRRELERVAAEHPDLLLLHGVELNIGPDGSVDYDPKFLEGFGWCVASVHSAFRRPAGEQTARLVRAIRNPAVTAVGHLTGRMLGRRRGIALDLGPVLDALVETGTALEINCSPRRLDAPAEVVEAAAGHGVRFVVSTDAHHVDALDNVEHGIRLARRAGLAPDQVVNTWPRQRFLDWVDEVRRG